MEYTTHFALQTVDALLDFETKSATFCKNFLFDCLITPKREVQELGDFDVETFPLLVLVCLESMEVKSGLILVVVTPLKPKDIDRVATHF